MKNLKPALYACLVLSIMVMQCQHDDEPVPVNVTGVQRGTETLSCTNCTPLVSNGASSDFSTGGVPSGVWYFDKAHSGVLWETPYRGIGSLLTGRFNYFVLTDLSIDEQNPSNISFEGFVRLNSVNTGEPARDGGCLLSTYGTDASKSTESENLATIKSTSAQFRTEDTGYNVQADLTFHGITKQVTVKLYYVSQTYVAASGYTLAGIEAEFEILALTDYLIESSNIDDRVKVKVFGTLRKKD